MVRIHSPRPTHPTPIKAFRLARVIYIANGVLATPIDHFAFPTIDQFLEKHIRYSIGKRVCRPAWKNVFSPTSRGREFHGRANGNGSRNPPSGNSPFPNWLRFAYHYFVKRGFLDGKEGYVFCHLLAEYEFWIAAKRFEMGVTPFRR